MVPVGPSKTVIGDRPKPNADNHTNDDEKHLVGANRGCGLTRVSRGQTHAGVAVFEPAERKLMRFPTIFMESGLRR